MHHAFTRIQRESAKAAKILLDWRKEITLRSGLRRIELLRTTIRGPLGQGIRPPMSREAQMLVLRILSLCLSISKTSSKEVVLLQLSATRMAHNSEIFLGMFGLQYRRTKRALFETTVRRETRTADQRTLWRADMVETLVVSRDQISPLGKGRGSEMKMEECSRRLGARIEATRATQNRQPRAANRSKVRGPKTLKSRKLQPRKQETIP